MGETPKRKESSLLRCNTELSLILYDVVLFLVEQCSFVTDFLPQTIERAFRLMKLITAYCVDSGTLLLMECSLVPNSNASRSRF